MNQENLSSASIIKKKNKAIIFIGIIFLIVSLILGLRVYAHVSDSVTGIHDSSLMNAATLESARRSAAIQFNNSDYYEETKQRIADGDKKAKIHGFVSVPLFITGIILLCLSSRHCSECGTKVAIDTAKKCGSCGTHFT